jgi:trans-aconitate 3-methyltransferase
MSGKQTESPFQSYTSDQASAYIQGRGTYPPALYSLILSHHTSTGGHTNHILDIGTGPGNGLRPLALSFNHASGFDTSPGMIARARELGGKTKTDEPIKFDVASAETLGSGIQTVTVDMIISANAAHWFSMPQFWTQAAKLLKPGGTVAIWTLCRPHVHPSTPNAAKIKSALDTLDRSLDPYRVGPNRLAYDMYADLALPWTIDPLIPGFNSTTFVRREWNRDGKLEDGEDDFFMSRQVMTVKQFETGLLTSSPAQRWREAHPESVETEEEPARVAGKAIREALRAEGAGENDTFKGGFSAVLLMVKRV